MKIHYLEIVASDIDAVCAAYEATHSVTFGPPEAVLGGARTAPLPDGGTLGVRGPLRDTEQPIVRPYWLVDDLNSAVEAASQAGATIAIRSMEIPGKGKIAIYIHGGIEHGLWQL